MAVHQRDEGCRGFKIKILEEVDDGEDILAIEELWIKSWPPEINAQNYSSDKNALNKMYKLEIIKKLLNSGKDAVKFFKKSILFVFLNSWGGLVQEAKCLLLQHLLCGSPLSPVA